MTHYTFTLTVSLATGSHVCVICSHALTATRISLSRSLRSLETVCTQHSRARCSHMCSHCSLAGSLFVLDPNRRTPHCSATPPPVIPYLLAARWYACQSGHVRAPVGRGGHGVVSGRKVSAQLCPYPCNEVCTSIAGAQASVGRLWEEAVHKLLIILV